MPNDRICVTQKKYLSILSKLKYQYNQKSNGELE